VTSLLSTWPGARRAVALGPLLAAIGREVSERSEALAPLLVRRERARLAPAERALLEAECALHRRELRHCYGELERLGCRVVGWRPLVFLVDARCEGEDGVLFWCC
jgi:hypothetical protein